MQNNTSVKELKRTSSVERSDAGTEVSKVAIYVVGAFAAAVGIWSLACIVGGIVSSGGVSELLSSWFKAVTGG
jgi:hypothetical protein